MGGITEVMFNAALELFGMGQAPSFTWKTTFTGLFATLPVQHTVMMSGLVPVTFTMDPGSRVAAWVCTASVVAGSGSLNTKLKQTGRPLHTSMVLGAVINEPGGAGDPGPPGPFSVASLGCGGVPVQGMQMKAMSRITVPM